jgi:hypothetical protein
MRLFLTDYHLETARLIVSFDSAQELSTDVNQKIFNQTASEQLIEETGYKRRWHICSHYAPNINNRMTDYAFHICSTYLHKHQ